VNRSNDASRPLGTLAPPEYRLVRDRERFRYGIHAVHLHPDTGEIAAWTPEPVVLTGGTPDALKALLLFGHEAMLKPVLDREDLADALEVVSESPLP